MEEGEPLPASDLAANDRERDLGWMLHDIDFEHGATSRFFHARLESGVLEVEKLVAEGLAT